jgi:hypothetical protein
MDLIIYASTKKCKNLSISANEIVEMLLNNQIDNRIYPMEYPDLLNCCRTYNEEDEAYTYLLYWNPDVLGLNTIGFEDLSDYHGDIFEMMFNQRLFDGFEGTYANHIKLYVGMRLTRQFEEDVAFNRCLVAYPRLLLFLHSNTLQNISDKDWSTYLSDLDEHYSVLSYEADRFARKITTGSYINKDIHAISMMDKDELLHKVLNKGNDNVLEQKENSMNISQEEISQDALLTSFNIPYGTDDTDSFDPWILT